MAPEVLTRRQYGKACDVWGAGVTLHVLLSGRLPFNGSGRRLQEAIARGRVTVCGAVSHEVNHGKSWRDSCLIGILNPWRKLSLPVDRNQFSSISDKSSLIGNVACFPRVETTCRILMKFKELGRKKSTAESKFNYSWRRPNGNQYHQLPKI